MLAVVYASFWQIEKDKFRNLLLHKRKACQRAFRLLVSKKNPDHITFKHFEGLLKYFKPNMSKYCRGLLSCALWVPRIILDPRMLERYLVFKAQTHQQCSLGVSTCLTPIPSREPGLLTLDKFYSIYNLSAFEWKPKQEPLPWYSNLRKPLPFIFQLNTKFVQWKGFRGAVYGIIFANGAVMIMRAIEISNDPQIQGKDLKGTWDIYVFVGLYALEAVLKLLGLGVTGYFRSGWNTYDFAVTVSAILGACAEAFLDAPFVFVLILRPMRLLRLFKLKRRYRDVFSALVIVLPRMASAAIVLLIVYYFFAVAGMELFSEIDLRNCCKNTSVQDYFVYNANTTGIPFSGDYFLNNFEDLFRSGVTLFELTVVNNWFVIMIGFTVATGSEWTRLYFMSFYVVTLIVLTIIVSVILEAFLFRIQYEKKVRAAEVSRHNPQPILKDEDFLSVEVSVWPEELQQVCLPDNASGDPLVFVGRRKRTKAVLQTSMYREEIKDWLLDAEEQEAEQTRI
ncbi:unnamed protein product [Notodromas monacha]|uniref:Ion transport domain-containing protein n=1 Tax=Notodromas monacha TaxID=399045 RepID=A0A7R9BJE4_9CRUS|nr:unnamed protein product [Notodromas monacha]CAG0916598.1 unnamed protein product [Notodromas monacha]